MVGRAVPNSQGHPGTQRAAARAGPAPLVSPTCLGTGGGRRSGALQAWGQGPCIAGSVGLSAGDKQMLLYVGGGAVIAEWGPEGYAVPSSFILLLLPSPSSCPVPQHIPGISALASRLSQPCSSHECPFPPAGSGCVLAQSHRSSRSVAIVTLLLVSESPGRSALGLVPSHLSIT